MRILRRFTVAEIMATAEVEPQAAYHFIRPLKKTGFLRVVQAKSEGVIGGHEVLVIVRNTGPHHPMLNQYKTVVLDANTNTEYRLEGNHANA